MYFLLDYFILYIQYESKIFYILLNFGFQEKNRKPLLLLFEVRFFFSLKRTGYCVGKMLVSIGTEQDVTPQSTKI